MTESYTPQEFTDLINSKNKGPTYDPLGTEALRKRLLDTQAQGGDILAQAELQKQEEEYLISPEGKIAKAEQDIQDMKTWLLSDRTYNSEEVDNIIIGLTVEYDEDTDKAIVRGDLWLRGLTSAEGLTLPENVGGDLNLGGLRSAEGLKLPENVGGYLMLGRLTSAESLQLPKNVGGSLDLSGLTSAEGLQLPESVGRGLDLSGLISAEKQKIKEERPDLMII